jgi:hypothetical protein
MPEPELDPKLVDRALDDYQRGRDALGRDLLLGAVALVTCQFLIVFGIINLTTQRQGLEKEAARRRVEKGRLDKEQAALKAVAGGISNLRLGLTNFDTRLGQQSQQEQARLKDQLLGLATWAQRRAKTPSLAEPPPLPTESLRQKLLGVVRGDPNFFRDDSRGDFADVVHDGICVPAMTELNREKDRLFRETVADPVAQVVAAVRTDFADDDLKNLGNDLAGELSRLLSSLEGVRFKDPPLLDWGGGRTLMDYMSQKGEARDKDIVAGAITVHDSVRDGGDSLKAAAEALAREQERVARSLGEIDAALAQVNEELARTDADLKRLEDQSEKFLSAWSVVAPSPEILVRYYPVALVAALGWFVWRSIRLRQAADRLARVIRARGVSEEVLAAGYPEMALAGRGQSFAPRAGRLGPRLTLLVWAVPGALALASMACVLTSEVYGAPARGLLIAVYCFAALALAGIYAVLLRAVKRAAKGMGPLAE